MLVASAWLRGLEGLQVEADLPGVGLVRVQLEASLQVRQPQIRLALVQQQDAELSMGKGVFGVDPQRPLEEDASSVVQFSNSSGIVPSPVGSPCNNQLRLNLATWDPPSSKLT